MSIEEKIREAIHKYRMEMFGVYPHFLLIHFRTVHKLETEIYQNYRGLASFIHQASGIILFEGIQIIRTSDIPEDEVWFSFNDIDRLKKMK